MTNPHDTLFHHTFGKPRHAEGWLRSVLPSAVGAAFAWETLRPAPERIDGHDLRLHVADVILVAELRTGGLVLHVLEHQSSAKASLHAQLLRYAVHLGARGFPLLCTVLYHGRRPWRRADPWAAMLGRLTARVARAIAAAQARVGFFLDDLAGCSEADLRRPGLTAQAQLTLLCLRCLRFCTVAQALDAIDRWGDLLRFVDRDPSPGSGREATDVISCYFLRATEVPAEALHEAFDATCSVPRTPS